jgi:hypothetical protein
MRVLKVAGFWVLVLVGASALLGGCGDPPTVVTDNQALKVLGISPRMGDEIPCADLQVVVVFSGEVSVEGGNGHPGADAFMVFKEDEASGALETEAIPSSIVLSDLDKTAKATVIWKPNSTLAAGSYWVVLLESIAGKGLKGSSAEGLALDPLGTEVRSWFKCK